MTERPEKKAIHPAKAFWVTATVSRWVWVHENQGAASAVKAMLEQLGPTATVNSVDGVRILGTCDLCLDVVTTEQPSMVFSNCNVRHADCDKIAAPDLKGRPA